MDDLVFYFCPLTCGRVTMTALEQAGAAYDARLINVMKGENKTPDYLAINPQGTVPALQVGDRVLTENASLVLYIADRFPDAALFPQSGDLVERARMRSDLIWCSATLHPIARQIRAPRHYTLGDAEAVKAKGSEAITPVLERLEQRLAGGAWWYGERWSIIDVYLSWIYEAVKIGVDVCPYPALAAHNEHLRAWPSFERMRKREAAEMEAVGMTLPPGVLG